MWVEMNFRDNEQFAHTFFIIVMFADLKTYVFKQKLIITLPEYYCYNSVHKACKTASSWTARITLMSFWPTPALT